MPDMIEVRTTLIDAATGATVIFTEIQEAQEPGPVPVPERVSRFQARAALLDAGLLGEVETALAGAGVLAQLAWAEAVEFRRNSPMIEAMGAGLGLAGEQIDALFIAAAQIEV